MLKNRTRSKVWWVVLIIAALSLPCKSFGLSLEIGPDEIAAFDVPIGQKVMISSGMGQQMKLRIKNKSASACAYTIDILPVARTTDTLKNGYVDIPDTSWVYPEQKEIRVNGNSTAYIELYVEIPKEEKYYGKRYQAAVEVKSKKNRPDELFVVACQLRVSVCVFDPAASRRNGLKTHGAKEPERQSDKATRSQSTKKAKDQSKNKGLFGGAI